MEISSRQRGSIQRAVCLTIGGRTRGNGLPMTSVARIWLLLLVMPVISESEVLPMTADKDSALFDLQRKGERNLRPPRFISFDHKAGKIDIDLEVKIPFLSFPLENRNNKTGVPMPIVKVNYKSIVFFGTLMALITFVIPLLFTELPNQSSQFYNYYPHLAKEHKRLDRGLDLTSYLGDSLNEILNETNSKLAPCIGRLVCSAVATTKRAHEPTSFNLIVDAFSSHSLLKKTVNSTVIKDAAAKGRRVSSAEDCTTAFSECAFDQKILLNILKMIGL